VYDSLAAFAVQNNLRAAYIATAVGSVTEVTIRFANQPSGTLVGPGHFEVVSLVGTVATSGSHVHISVSDALGATIGGHLLPGSKVHTAGSPEQSSQSSFDFCFCNISHFILFCPRPRFPCRCIPRWKLSSENSSSWNSHDNHAANLAGTSSRWLCVTDFAHRSESGQLLRMCALNSRPLHETTKSMSGFPCGGLMNPPRYILYIMRHCPTKNTMQCFSVAPDPIRQRAGHADYFQHGRSGTAAIRPANGF
jgi:hypothetical protein